MLDLKNILYPIDLDSENSNTVKTAMEMAILFGGAIHFLYVNDEMAGYRHPTEYEDTVALKVKQLVSNDLIDKSNIVYATTKGDYSTEIKHYCQQKKIDLIITNHKHHSQLFSDLFDTLDENIIDTVNIPVLVLPRE
jgi:nucleotide-binding universal stress UspA family protein